MEFAAFERPWWQGRGDAMPNEFASELRLSIDRFCKLLPLLVTGEQSQVRMLVAANRLHSLTEHLIDVAAATTNWPDGTELGTDTLRAGLRNFTKLLAFVEAEAIRRSSDATSFDEERFLEHLRTRPAEERAMWLKTNLLDIPGSSGGSSALLASMPLFDLGSGLRQLKAILLMLLEGLQSRPDADQPQWVQILRAIARALKVIDQIQERAAGQGAFGAGGAAAGAACHIYVYLLRMRVMGHDGPVTVQPTFRIDNSIRSEHAMPFPAPTIAGGWSTIPVQMKELMSFEKGSCGAEVEVNVTLEATVTSGTDRATNTGATVDFGDGLTCPYGQSDKVTTGVTLPTGLLHVEAMVLVLGECEVDEGGVGGAGHF